MTRARVTYAIKATIAATLYYTGLLGLWQAVVLRRKAVVLMYHRVLSAEDRRATGSHPGIVVDRGTFARHMSVLKRRFRVLSVEQLAQRIGAGQPLPDSSCVITFDDGWRDNVVNALPILEREGLPAVIFLPVNYIGRRRLFWREGLTHLLVRAVDAVRADPARRPRLEAVLAGTGLARVFDVRDQDARPAAIDAIDSDRTLSWETAWPLLEALEGALGLSLEDMETPDGFMDWQDVERLASRRVVFGGHSAEHRPLTELTEGEVEAELAASKALLGGAIAPVLTFSYPNGALNSSVVSLVERAGYRLAFSTEPGFVTSGDDPFRLRRVNIHEDVTDTTPMFLARLVGLF